MLAITAVDGCRYCSYFHARLALKAGIGQEEIGKLLSGDVSGCPKEETLAVLYAQHWAESSAHPDPDAVQKLHHSGRAVNYVVLSGGAKPPAKSPGASPHPTMVLHSSPNRNTGSHLRFLMCFH